MAEAAGSDRGGHEEASGMKRLWRWWVRRQREAMREAVAQAWRETWDEEMARGRRLGRL